MIISLFILPSTFCADYPDTHHNSARNPLRSLQLEALAAERLRHEQQQEELRGEQQAELLGFFLKNVGKLFLSGWYCLAIW